MNITIDDTNPRIRYYSTVPNSAVTWTAASIQHDPGMAYYFKTTFSLTALDGDRMVLTFNGSSIWVYGGRNVERGWYSAQIDDFATERFETGAPPARQYQTVLYHKDGLDASKEHTITMTNIPSDSRKQQGLVCYLDIDYIVTQQPVTANIYTTELDDAHTQIQYSGSWTAEVHADGFRGHVSVEKGDTMTLPFNGSSIEVFGTLFPDHGNYTVSIDGVDKGEYRGVAIRPMYGVSLFSASGLSDNQHTIVMTNLGGLSGNFFDIDRITFNSTIQPSSSGSSIISPSPIHDSPAISSSRQDTPFPTGMPLTDKKDPVSVAGIAGGIAGGLVALVFIAGIAWFLWRKKRTAREDAKRAASQIDLTGEEIKPYQDSPGVEEVRSTYSLGGSDMRLEQVRSDYFTLGPSSTSQGTEYASALATPSGNGGYHPSHLSSVTAGSTTRDNTAPVSPSALLPGSSGLLRPVDSKSTLSGSTVTPLGMFTVVNPSNATSDAGDRRYDDEEGIRENISPEREGGDGVESGPPAYNHAMVRQRPVMGRLDLAC